LEVLNRIVAFIAYIRRNQHWSRSKLRDFIARPQQYSRNGCNCQENQEYQGCSHVSVFPPNHWWRECRPNNVEKERNRSRILLLPCELHHVSRASGQPSLAFMQNRSMFTYCCEMIGRASALITFAGMGSLVLAATVIDVLR